MKRKAGAVRQCGVCGRWTSEGDAFSSGDRDWRSGQTPIDKFHLPALPGGGSFLARSRSGV
jgi:hypothetical protein